MRPVLDWYLRRLIVLGRLTVRWPDGTETSYAGAPGPEASVVLTDARAVRELALNPALAFGETYMDGRLVPVGCTIYDVLDVLLASRGAAAARSEARLRRLLSRVSRRIQQFNPAGRARRNVAHHYDLNGRLYSLFLDRDRQYSCAYFPTGDETLEEAQTAKKRHIAAKLKLDRPDLEVLDIGSGWGGMALTLARDYGARVTGITLSTEQLAELRRRAPPPRACRTGSGSSCMDYRGAAPDASTASSRSACSSMSAIAITAPSSMWCGAASHPTAWRCCTPSAAADGPGGTNPWLTKYIFPGGYCPALSEVLPAVEKPPGCSPPTSKSCGCTTPRPCATGAAASPPTATPSPGSTTSDSAACSNSTWPASELTFRREGQMVFQIQLTRDQRRCRSPATTCSRPSARPPAARG